MFKKSLVLYVLCSFRFTQIVSLLMHRYFPLIINDNFVVYLPARKNALRNTFVDYQQLSAELRGWNMHNHKRGWFLAGIGSFEQHNRGAKICLQ